MRRLSSGAVSDAC